MSKTISTLLHDQTKVGVWFFVVQILQTFKLESPVQLLYPQLFTDKCPKTCENFKQLCIGDKEEGDRHSPPLQLSYKNCIFHRVVGNGWIQSGGTSNAMEYMLFG